MDYYNDFQRMVRSDNIEQVIDRYRVRKGRDCTDSDTKRSLNEVRDVLDSLKACSRITYPALLKLFKYCASFTTLQLALFLHILQGLPLISFANSEGISEQAAHQMWVRMVAKNPGLATLRKKRRAKYDGKRTPSSTCRTCTHGAPDSPCDLLESRAGQSGGMRQVGS